MLIPSPLESLNHPLFAEKEINVYIKRDDLIHPEISGNKWRKLKHNLREAKAQNRKTILTFGGAYSNHISATSAVGKIFKLKTVGVIRGEETLPLNPTLLQAKKDGMRFLYVSRTDYRKKNTPEFITKLKEKLGDFYTIPEGGGNKLGVKGCNDIVNEIDINFDYILTDCGTGATLAGICDVLKVNQKAIGIPVLKGGEFIKNEVKLLLGDTYNRIETQYSLETGYHFGGYAKYNQELILFMRNFFIETNIKTDPVYTGKLFYAFVDLAKKNYFKRGSTIVVVHTGGLQGIEGFEKRHGFSIFDKKETDIKYNLTN
jgi:1-aminocyclopropane-1-carboxylate deaminase/D-cysteine desulfhydrase-like pyridoxal-dependent ACC family enzyme